MKSNVYTPGAGHFPPVLAGRQALLQSWTLSLDEIVTQGRTRARDLILVGPRGVGKTSAMTALARLAEDQDFEVVDLQAFRGQSGLVEGLTQQARRRIDSESGPWTRARRSFDRLVSLTVGAAGVSVGMSTHEPRAPQGSAVDVGTLADVLAALAVEIRRDHPRGGLVITIDELQVAAPTDLALMAGALHRLNVRHREVPVAFLATGLPHTPEALAAAGVTHPDRLFVVEGLPVALGRQDAAYAVVEPARRAGVSWDPEALDAVLTTSSGYPSHLQVFADAAWHAAEGPDVITAGDARVGIAAGIASLRTRTWEPNWSRLSDRQIEYLAAVAVQGGRASSSALAEALDQPAGNLSRIRDQLIKDGFIYAPRRGHVNLTEPIFGEFIVRNYDEARGDAAVPLAPLEEMHARLQRMGRHTAWAAGSPGGDTPPGEIPASPARERPGDRARGRGRHRER